MRTKRSLERLVHRFGLAQLSSSVSPSLSLSRLITPLPPHVARLTT